MPTDSPQPSQHYASRDEFARAMIGRVIGDFEIRREIGRGGMGTVFEAWQESLQRLVAVKILATPAGLNSTSVQRFKREAQAAAKLHHANIVRVYAQGEQDGIYYYAMELIDGQSIYELIEQARNPAGRDLGITQTQVMDPTSPQAGHGHLTDSASASWTGEAITQPIIPPPTGSSHPGKGKPTRTDSGNLIGLSATTIDKFDTIARLIATVAEALEYAHQMGVIHRDIKPHNLLLGNDGRLSISDFGLARVLEQPGVTMTGEFLGSPLYMSPEQLTGVPGKVDHRTDIYSLGTTLYEWLTLQPPFPGQRRDEVITGIITAEPTPLRTLNAKVPVDLETICLKAIEKDPNRRYQTAAEVAQDLHLHLERSTIKARSRRTGIRRLVRSVQRHSVGVLVAVLALVITLFGATLLKQRRLNLQAEGNLPAETTVALVPSLPKPTLPQPANDVGGQTTDSSGQTPGPTTVFGPAGPLVLPLPTNDVALQKRREAYERIGAELSKAFLGDDQDPATNLTTQLSEFERYVAEALAEVQIGIHGRALVARLNEGTLPQAPAGSAQDLYRQALRTNDPAESLALIDQAVALEPQSFTYRHLRTVALCRLLRFEDFQLEAQLLFNLRNKSAQSRLMLGASLLLNGQPGEALRYLTLGGLESETPWFFTLRGLCRARLSDFGGALANYSRALAMDPENEIARFARGRAQFYLGVYDAALLDADKVVEWLTDSIEARIFRAECHDKLGNYDLAIQDYNEAIRLGGNPITVGAKLMLAATNARVIEAAAQALLDQADDPRPTTQPSRPATTIPLPPAAGDDGTILDQILNQFRAPGRRKTNKPADDELPVP